MFISAILRQFKFILSSETHWKRIITHLETHFTQAHGRCNAFNAFFCPFVRTREKHNVFKKKE